ncbi:MAG: AraC family transcriptional regulator, partial [Prevotellaceae bacterium]|nr:AraC family transcriptional regulator [Prevotellaceae bacterium]
MKNIVSKESIHCRYIIANEQDMLWGLTINTVGKQYIGANESYPPRNHPTRYFFSTERGRILNEYQLLYITKGSGTFVSQSHKQVELK